MEVCIKVCMEICMEVCTGMVWSDVGAVVLRQKRAVGKSKEQVCLSIFRRRDGRGVRFLRLKDKRVFARQDVVVHQDTMPFRGVGGLVK